MGWSFCFAHTKRKMLIEDLCRNWSYTGYRGTLLTIRVIAHCYRGNPGNGILWSVQERYNEKTGEIEDRMIRCDKMHYSRFDGCWGYKPMCEREGPYYYSCPQRYLDMTPKEINPGFNPSWRNTVEGLHNMKKTTRSLKKLNKRIAVS